MKSRATQTAGTAKEIADHGDGFSANGTSLYSRRLAHTPDINLTVGRRSEGRLIREVTQALSKLAARIGIEKDPTRRMKLSKDYAIKSKFLERLKSGNGRERIDVTTLPGADEYDKWDDVT